MRVPLDVVLPTFECFLGSGVVPTFNKGSSKQKFADHIKAAPIHSSARTEHEIWAEL